MKVFLFATNHNVQRGSLPPELPDERTRFESEVSLIAKSQCIDLLAEELNKECVSTALEFRTSSVLQDLSAKLAVPHLFCEPTLTERKATRFIGDELERWREAYWLKAIQGKSASNVLFILGANHLKSFKALLSENYIEAVVVHSDWGSS